MRIDEVATVRNEQDGRSRARLDQGREPGRDVPPEHRRREFVDLASDDERMRRIDERTGLSRMLTSEQISLCLGERSRRVTSVHAPG